MDLRPGSVDDIRAVASWIRSPDDCRLWAGKRVTFPIDVHTLPSVLELPHARCWCLSDGGELLGLGQIVPKPSMRLHLARLIVSPRHRGLGLGKHLAESLSRIARDSSPAAVSLNVDANNAVAIALYRHLGFVSTTRPPDEAESTSLYMEYRADVKRDVRTAGEQ